MKMSKLDKTALTSFLRILLLLSLLSLGIFIAARGGSEQDNPNKCQGCPHSSSCRADNGTTACQ